VNSEFKIGDRFFLKEIGSCLTLSSYNKCNGIWRADWKVPDSVIIVPEQLERLKFYDMTMIKINDDKHLLELQLRYG
jgi:hypothetical protein